MKNLVLFITPYVVPNLYAAVYNEKDKRKFLKKLCIVLSSNMIGSELIHVTNQELQNKKSSKIVSFCVFVL